jgi:hypothetical protein
MKAGFDSRYPRQVYVRRKYDLGFALNGDKTKTEGVKNLSERNRTLYVVNRNGWAGLARPFERRLGRRSPVSLYFLSGNGEVWPFPHLLER